LSKFAYLLPIWVLSSQLYGKGVSSSYLLTHDSGQATSLVSDASKLSDYNFGKSHLELLQKSIESLDQVQNVVVLEGEDVKATGSDWLAYESTNRQSQLAVTLDISGRQIGLQFEVEEVMRACKPKLDPETWCTSANEITINGPTKVFGNFAVSALGRFDNLLLNAATLAVKVTKPYQNNMQLSIASRLTMKDRQYMSKLRTFLERFSLATILDDSAGTPLDSTVLLLASARLMRQINENMIDQL
jgi:hypothetical protein